MKLTIDISKDRYDEIMAMDWANCRRFFDEEIRAIHDGIPQRTGQWISTETKGVKYAFWCRYKCSLCGELSDRKNYCPNCGAKMEVEDAKD